MEREAHTRNLRCAEKELKPTVKQAEEGETVLKPKP